MAKLEIPPETGMWRPRPCYHDPLANNNTPCAICQAESFKQTIDPEFDAVNHPSHYTAGSIECIEAIKAALTPEEFRGFCKGNALAYIWRERFKGKNQDIEKAVVHLNWLKEQNGTDK